MDQVLGTTAGNALEVREPIDYLTGAAREPRLHEVTLALAAYPVAGTVVGLLIGLEHLQLIVADVSHAVLTDKRVQLEADFSPSEAVEIVQQLVGEAYAELGVSSDTILGVGIAVGGPINPTNGRVIQGRRHPNLGKASTSAACSNRGLEQPVFADNAR